MKYINKLKKAAPLLLLPIMGSAIATDITVPLNFTTLPVITIAEITPMAFGDVLTLTQADTCTMSISAGTALTPTDEGTDVTDGTIWGTGPLTALSVGQLGSDCSGDGQVGIYEITSFKDADITVSVTAGTTTEIQFVPNGYVLDLDEANTLGVVSREPLSIGTDADVNASEDLTAYAAEGTNRAIIGGTITNLVPLTAGGTYATDFNLNVVYQ